MEAPEGFPASQYITNIGLALKEVPASEKGATAYSLVNFNALPEVYIPKPRPISEILFVPTIIVGIALVALGAFFTLNASVHTSDLRADLASINQMAISRHVQAKDISALNKQVSSLEATSDAFTTTLHDFRVARDEINTDLGEVSKLPGEVDLNSVSHGGSTVTVTGTGDDEDAVFHYARQLRDAEDSEGNRRFSLVVITNMGKQEHQTSFTLRLVK